MKKYNVGIYGNPQSGKTLLFNNLVGLDQNTKDNFSTTLYRQGQLLVGKDLELNFFDFQSIYSATPNLRKEVAVIETLINNKSPLHPDVILVVSKITQLSKYFFLTHQLIDLKIPIIVVITHIDLIERENLHNIVGNLQKIYPQITFCPLSNTTKEGVNELVTLIENFTSSKINLVSNESLYYPSNEQQLVINRIGKLLNISNPYVTLVIVNNYKKFNYLSPSQKNEIENILSEELYQQLPNEVEETMKRYESFEKNLHTIETELNNYWDSKKEGVIDNLITNRIVWPIFFLSFFLVGSFLISIWINFTYDLLRTISIADLARQFQFSSDFYRNIFIGLLYGISSFIFIGSLACCNSFLLQIFRDTNLDQRLVFLTDRIFNLFGLSGRSIYSYLSSFTCSIVSVRSFKVETNNVKENMLTNLMLLNSNCSGQVLIYVLIAFFLLHSFSFANLLLIFVSVGFIMFFFNLSYMLIISSIFSLIFKSSEAPALLMLELNTLKTPKISNVLDNVWVTMSLFINRVAFQIISGTMFIYLLLRLNSKFHSTENINESIIYSFSNFFQPVFHPLHFTWQTTFLVIVSLIQREFFIVSFLVLSSNGFYGTPLGHKELIILFLFLLFSPKCLTLMKEVKLAVGHWGYVAVYSLTSFLVAYFICFIASKFI